MNENCEAIPRKTKFNVFVAIRKLFYFKREYKTINVEYPNGWANCGITTDNHFIADTNNSTNWDTLEFPLPKPKYKWNIKCYGGTLGRKINKNFVVLIDRP